MPLGKKYKAAVASYDIEMMYPSSEAIAKAKSLATAKFDETIELAVRLGLDPRKADQAVRGTVALPSGTGKTVRVAVFAAGEAAQAARDAGADIVGTDDLAAAIEAGKMDFDIAISTRLDANGRKIGSCTRTTWSDAKPKDWHRHVGRCSRSHRI